MAEHSTIEWTDATWNPVSGCSKVSPGCAHCYAERIFPRTYRWARRDRAIALRERPQPRAFTEVWCHEERLDAPLRWQRPRRIFVNSMSDLFHEAVPDVFIDRVFAVMALAPQHTFQILTKRAERMRAYFDSHPEELRNGRIHHLDLRERIDDEAGNFSACHANLDAPGRWPLPNVWLGVSVEHQHFADARIPLLLQSPAAVRFISAEPLLGPLELAWEGYGPYEYGYRHQGIDWVIVGGESGPDARPFDLAWARSVVQQCKAVGVPCFVKQIGARPYSSQEAGWPLFVNGRTPLADRKGGDPLEWPADLRIREYPR